ncbi:MAG TPA: TIGR04283 family arsenosugar biosynthesis glycosyltransferase [Acetobacteraceae bacterium]|jgi:rSAM/selenodomain-associated transferase 2|nr:TIGR04283 family arsenosugar biosynthesis glycosyltransferase [Acetobacteraceae bacterium]
MTTGQEHKKNILLATLPPVGGLSREADQGRGEQKCPHRPGATPAISVVIPTLNAETTLPATIAALSWAAEIIVVDGGSSDATVAIAAGLAARVVAAPCGRGSQLAAGARSATHDWLLLLHADTSLSQDAETAIRAHTRTPPIRAAYFRFALDSTDARARRLERLVAWRCRVFGLPYGDQGLLLHRTLLQEAGGIRPLPLMEDVDLVRRLGRHRLTQLDAAAVTSAAKWERDGWHLRSARNLLCLILWFIGIPPRRIAMLYR